MTRSSVLTRIKIRSERQSNSPDKAGEETRQLAAAAEAIGGVGAVLDLRHNPGDEQRIMRKGITSPNTKKSEEPRHLDCGLGRKTWKNLWLMRFAQKPRAAKRRMKMSMLQPARRPSLPMKILRRVDGCSAWVLVRRVEWFGGGQGRVVIQGTSGAEGVWCSKSLAQSQRFSGIARGVPSGCSGPSRRRSLPGAPFRPPSRGSRLPASRWLESLSGWLHRQSLAQTPDAGRYSRCRSSRDIAQGRVRLFAQAFLDVRVDRDDAISVALHVGRNAMAGTQRVCERPTTAMVLARCRSSAIGSGCGHGEGVDPPYFLLACSSFCLYIFSASLRMVSETSLLPEMFFRSWINRFFIKPRPRSSGVRGFATRLRTTL